ncbi:Protein ArsC [Bacillus paramycoides]
MVLLEASLYSLPSLWKNVYSTGIEAHGVNPNAIKAMKEVNIDITKQTSDIIDPNILM